MRTKSFSNVWAVVLHVSTLHLHGWRQQQLYNTNCSSAADLPRTPGTTVTAYPCPNINPRMKVGVCQGNEVAHLEAHCSTGLTFGSSAGSLVSGLRHEGCCARGSSYLPNRPPSQSTPLLAERLTQPRRGDHTLAYLCSNNPNIFALLVSSHRTKHL